MEPPLPQLSGPTPVPRPIKRARFAFALSIGAWLTFAMFWFAIAVLIKGEGEKSARLHSIFGWKINGDVVAMTALLTSGAFSIVGTVMGFTQRKSRIGKIAGILAGVPLTLWILFIGVGVLFFGGKK